MFWFGIDRENIGNDLSSRDNEHPNSTSIRRSFCLAKRKTKGKQQLHLQLWIGTAFLGAGLLAFILNQLHDTSTWAAVISVIMMCMGLLMAVRSKLKKQASVFSKMK